MLVAVFSRQGIGGRVMYGYRQVARVGKWTYKPEDNGGAVIDVELLDVDPVYGTKTDVSLELALKTGGTLTWPEAELISDACVVVAGAPAGAPQP